MLPSHNRNGAVPRTRRVLSHLYVQVLCGVLAGALVGWLWPDVGAALQPVGDGFVSLVKMMIAPIVFCTVVTGIASMADRRSVGRVGLKALLYFEVLTTVSMVLGLLVVNVVRPGAGLDIDVGSLDTGSLPAEATETHEGFSDFLLGIIPKTLISALTGGEILPVLLVAVLFGFGVQAVGPAGAGVLRGVESLSKVLFVLIRWIMRLAPLGAFGAMAFTIGNYGLGTVRQLAALIGSFWVTALFFVLVVLGAVMRLHGLRLLPLLRYLKEELLIVLGTSSTEPVLPRLMGKMEHAGASKPVVGLTVPAGYSFNLDGTAIYLTMGAVFLAQAVGVDLSLGQQLTMLLVMLLTSKGAAGVTGSGFVALAATLSAVPHVPVAALALIVGIDRFLSEGRALTSLVGNAVATLAVARWENALDLDRARRVLKGHLPGPATEDGAPAPEATAVPAQGVAPTHGGTLDDAGRGEPVLADAAPPGRGSEAPDSAREATQVHG